MKTHYLKLIDGSVLQIDEDIAEGIMRALENGSHLTIRGRYIPHGQVADFGSNENVEDENVANRMRIDQALRLEAGAGGLDKFWLKLVQLNFANHKTTGASGMRKLVSGTKPMLYRPVIVEAMKRSGLNEMEEIAEYVYLNYDELKEFNVPGSITDSRIANKAGKYCGKCENGWLFRKDPDEAYAGSSLARPCPCNLAGMRDIKKYREKLDQQGIGL